MLYFLFFSPSLSLLPKSPSLSLLQSSRLSLSLSLSLCPLFYLLSLSGTLLPPTASAHTQSLPPSKLPPLFLPSISTTHTHTHSLSHSLLPKSPLSLLQSSRLSLSLSLPSFLSAFPLWHSLTPHPQRTHTISPSFKTSTPFSTFYLHHTHTHTLSRSLLPKSPLSLLQSFRLSISLFALFSICFPSLVLSYPPPPAHTHNLSLLQNFHPFSTFYLHHTHTHTLSLSLFLLQIFCLSLFFSLSLYPLSLLSFSILSPSLQLSFSRPLFLFLSPKLPPLSLSLALSFFLYHSLPTTLSPLSLSLFIPSLLPRSLFPPLLSFQDLSFCIGIHVDNRYTTSASKFILQVCEGSYIGCFYSCWRS